MTSRLMTVCLTTLRRQFSSLLLLTIAGCSGAEQPLSGDAGASRLRKPDAAVAVEAGASEAPGETSSQTTTPDVQPDAGFDWPGTELSFELSEQVYIDLAVPRVVTATDPTRLDWDLRFEQFQAFTNGGAAGAGAGASFGPSTDLDLLFDTIPDVPMRADLSDGAMMGWFWFSDAGIASRYHIYGLRDAEGHLFKVQVLGYYGGNDAGRVSAQITLRYAEVTADGVGETQELANIDASSGGISAPADAPSGCVNLARGETVELTRAEWASSTDWHLCFQRTDVFINQGLSGPGNVAAVDLEVDPETGQDLGLTDAERARSADSERARFDAVSYEDLSRSSLGWDKVYDVLPRIGTRWLQGSPEEPSLVPGTWFIRGADGDHNYAVYFTAVSPSSPTAGARVNMQVKALAPIDSSP